MKIIKNVLNPIIFIGFNTGIKKRRVERALQIDEKQLEKKVLEQGKTRAECVQRIETYVSKGGLGFDAEIGLYLQAKKAR